MAVAGQNTRHPPARPENYCESKQTYFSYSLDKVFHSPKIIFHAKLSGRFLLRQPLKNQKRKITEHMSCRVIVPFRLMTDGFVACCVIKMRENSLSEVSICLKA